MNDLKALIGKKVLVTCSAWFVAPDGQEYRSAWGTLHSINESKDVLGFVPRGNHANWFMAIGKMVITGCQLNYLIECEEKPEVGKVNVWSNHNGDFKEYTRPTVIYVCD